jgi:hypothetical protein
MADSRLTGSRISGIICVQGMATHPIPEVQAVNVFLEVTFPLTMLGAYAKPTDKPLILCNAESASFRKMAVHGKVEL